MKSHSNSGHADKPISDYRWCLAVFFAYLLLMFCIVFADVLHSYCWLLHGYRWRLTQLSLTFAKLSLTTCTVIADALHSYRFFCIVIADVLPSYRCRLAQLSLPSCIGIADVSQKCYPCHAYAYYAVPTIYQRSIRA